MKTTISIDTETIEVLRKRQQHPKETPHNIIRRMLNLPPWRRGPKGKKARQKTAK